MKKGKAMKEVAILLGFFVMFAWGLSYAQEAEQPQAEPAVQIEKQLIQQQIANIQLRLQLMQYQANELQQLLQAKRKELQNLAPKKQPTPKEEEK